MESILERLKQATTIEDFEAVISDLRAEQKQLLTVSEQEALMAGLDSFHRRHSTLQAIDVALDTAQDGLTRAAKVEKVRDLEELSRQTHNLAPQIEELYGEVHQRVVELRTVLFQAERLQRTIAQRNTEFSAANRTDLMLNLGAIRQKAMGEYLGFPPDGTKRTVMDVDKVLRWIADGKVFTANAMGRRPWERANSQAKGQIG